VCSRAHDTSPPFRRGPALVVAAEHRRQDLHDELDAFVEMAAQDSIRDGVRPAEARRLAVLHLGGIEQAKERVRVERTRLERRPTIRSVCYSLPVCC
jgi:hypothetical protein